MNSSVPDEAIALSAVTSIEISKAIERWLTAGQALDELGLVVEERSEDCRVIALSRRELRMVIPALGAGIPEQLPAALRMLDAALVAVPPGDIPCIFHLRGCITIGFTDVETAREDAARNALILIAGRPTESKDA